MSIPNDSLMAFLRVFEEGSFTAGAQRLGLTQSAVSQKIARLEDLLQSPLFVRLSKGLALTSAGERLLVFARAQLQHEQDFLQSFNQYGTALSGIYRLAGFSSINRSILIPALAPWMRQHPEVSLEFSSHEVVDLLPLLKSNRVDAAILDYHPHVPGIEEVVIGREEYVVIESTRHKNVPAFFLDHGPHDNATESYFKFQKKQTLPQRRFMGEVYAILDGVAAGLGRAVMSVHLVKDDRRFHIVSGYKPYERPLVLCFYRQSYYSPVHQQLLQILSQL